MKLYLGRRALRQVEQHDAWWAENRPTAPDLFAREFRDTLAVLETSPSVGERWPTPARPSLRRVLMPKTRNHIYFRVDEDKRVVHILAVWGAPKKGRPKL